MFIGQVLDLGIVGVLLFFGAVLVGAATIGSVVLERHQVYRNMRTVRSIELTPDELKQHEMARTFGERVLIPGVGVLGRFVRRFTPASVVERLTQELVYAGSPAGWDAERVLAFKLVGAVGLGIGAMVLGKGRVDPAQSTILAGLFAFIGCYLPEWIVRSRSGRRQEQIRRALPDALDLLSITVEAGLAFDAAVERVALQAGGPLGEELHRVIQEMQIGTARADALRSLSDRSTVQELKSFVLAMIQADVFGISISKVLHVQAREMRLKRRQRAEERAQKIPVKIVFPLIACTFPALLVVILGPAFMTIYKQFSH